MCRLGPWAGAWCHRPRDGVRRRERLEWAEISAKMGHLPDGTALAVGLAMNQLRRSPFLFLFALASSMTVACGDDGGSSGTGGGGGGSSEVAAGDACDAADDTVECVAPSGNASTRSCVDDGQGNLAWSECPEPSSSSTTPLVVSFGAPVSFVASIGDFALDPLTSVSTDWVAAETPWLALDRNGNGRIDDGGELFGSATVLASGGFAPNGFVALGELDANGDGRISPADPAFARLLLWSDRDGDRVSQADELVTVDAAALHAIELAFERAPACDARGNCAIERATMRYGSAGSERTGAVIDVHLRHR